jgi:hypothetical protein
MNDNKYTNPNILTNGLLLVLLLASLTACSRTNNAEESSFRDPTLERTSPSAAERPVSTPQQEDESSIDERPIARGGQLDTPSELYPGHPIGYYETQFKSMGYQIQEKAPEKGRINYKLKKGNILYKVSLIIPQGKTHVERIETKQYTLNSLPTKIR